MSRTLKYCFMIDSTGSMSDSITAAYEECINLASDAARISEMNVEFSVICYRDPVDQPRHDIHEYHDFTSNIEEIKQFLGKQKAYGGGDIAEDWVGAFDILFNNLSWGNINNTTRCLTIIADAPPHGSTFAGPEDVYPDESGKLISHIKKLVEENISVKMISVDTESLHAMNIFKDFYNSFGGTICDIKEIGIKTLKGIVRIRELSECIRAQSNSLVLTASQKQ